MQFQRSLARAMSKKAEAFNLSAIYSLFIKQNVTAKK